jgi:hypothetical protein
MSSSRPNACTISIPTTASSAASVTSPFRSCTSREIGETRRAKRSASTVIGGIAIAVSSASRGSTSTRTIAAETIIIRLCIPWTRPQPMK